MTANIPHSEEESGSQLRCPTSGVLLGAFVKAFGLDDPLVGGEKASKHLGSQPSLGRRAREYFRGAWVADEKRLELCGHVVDAVLASGLLHGLKLPPSGQDAAPPIDAFLTTQLSRWLGEWDSIYYQGASGWPHPPQNLGGFVLGRQLAIDLALRVSALIQLMGGCPPESILPLAGTERPGRSLFQSLGQEAGTNHTRESLAGALGVEKSTVDKWMDENRVPREANIQRLAELFATNERPQPHLLRWLRMQFGLIGLRNELEAAIGAHWSRELFCALACFIQWTLALHAQSKLERHVFLLGQVSVLQLGGRDPSSHWVLNSWLKVEKDRFWFDDILVAQQQGPKFRIQECFEVIGDWPAATQGWDADPNNAGLPVDERRRQQVGNALIFMSPRAFSEVFDVSAMPRGDPAERAEWRAYVAKAHMARGQYSEAVGLWKEVIAAFPQNAEYRCLYGICLWHARPDPKMDEALSELRRASELRPDWDNPIAEIARLYLYRGWTDFALQHLEDAPKELMSSSHDCTFTLAAVLVRLKRFADAFPIAQRATVLDPTHADAWDLAAECAFRLGDKVEGGRLAREALRLGQRRSFDLFVRHIGD